MTLLAPNTRVNSCRIVDFFTAPHPMFHPFRLVLFALFVVVTVAVGRVAHTVLADVMPRPPASTPRIAPGVKRHPPRELHVATWGLPDNDGSAARPLDLATALSRRSPAGPGDTIWLHSGTYRGAFESHLTGAPGAPIIVREALGERVAIDSGESRKDALLVFGGWTWFWGFEVTSSAPGRRSAETGSWPADLRRGGAITARGPALKFINLVVHDLTGGFGIWEESIGTEVYGSLIFYNGWYGPDRGHGHGIYTQNAAPSIRGIRDNILFGQFSHGIHAFGSERASLDNIEITGNVAFNNGALAGDFARDILLGGGRVAQNAVVTDNFTYGGAATNIGYRAGCAHATVTRNVFAGAQFAFVNCPADVYANIFVGPSATADVRAHHPANTFYERPPTDAVVRVRVNQYEPGRAHVVVYNWRPLESVRIALGAVCGTTRADVYEIRDAQDFLGSPLAIGRCRDQWVDVPLTGDRVAPAAGDVPVAPVHTSSEFAVFVIVPVGSSAPASPSTAPPGRRAP